MCLEGGGGGEKKRGDKENLASGGVSEGLPCSLIILITLVYNSYKLKYKFS